MDRDLEKRILNVYYIAVHFQKNSPSITLRNVATIRARSWLASYMACAHELSP